MTAVRRIAAAASTVLALAGPAAARPVRVMSMNQCADQLVMLLVPPERIASVTYRAEVGAATPVLRAKARSLRINHGLAEEVLAQKPDLIVAGLYTTPVTRKLVSRAGIPLLELGPAESFDAIRDQLRTLGKAVGESERAEALIREMDGKLAMLKRTAPARPIRIVGWSAYGRVPAKASLFDAILTAAGGVNLAAGDGAFETSLDLERLVRLKPQPELLLQGVAKPARPGDVAQHPVLARLYGGRRLAYDGDAYSCGTPQAAEEAAALRQAMLSALGGAPR